MPLFRRKNEPEPTRDHAVILHLPLSDDQFGTDEEREAIYRLEDELEEAVAAMGDEVDGHEFGNGQAVLYLSGLDADLLVEIVKRALGGFSFRSGAFAVKRYGPADDPAVRTAQVALDRFVKPS